MEITQSSRTPSEPPTVEVGTFHRGGVATGPGMLQLRASGDASAVHQDFNKNTSVKNQRYKKRSRTKSDGSESLSNIDDSEEMMEKVGHGMPYYFGHNTISLPKDPAVVEHSPIGFAATILASQPAKGGIGSMHAPKFRNRYFRHVIHCKGCRSAVNDFQAWENSLTVAALVSTVFAILVSGRQWKAALLFITASCLAGIHICSTAIAMNTTNFVRKHKML